MGYRAATRPISPGMPGLQLVVEKMLAAEGSSRLQLGRQAFEERVWAWKREYGGFITGQMRAMGASCDWSRERFTLDAQLSGALPGLPCTYQVIGLDPIISLIPSILAPRQHGHRRGPFSVHHARNCPLIVAAAHQLACC